MNKLFFCRGLIFHTKKSSPLAISIKHTPTLHISIDLELTNLLPPLDEPYNHLTNSGGAYKTVQP